MLLPAEIIDRIAVSVGNRVITESDLDREIRVTAFLNGVQPDFSPAGKRATAHAHGGAGAHPAELETSRYPVPSAAEVAPVLEEFKKEHFPNAAEYQRAFGGLRHRRPGCQGRTALAAHAAAVHRRCAFDPAVQVSDRKFRNISTRWWSRRRKPRIPASRSRWKTIATGSRRRSPASAPTGKWSTWLKEARSRTEIVYHEEAFQ